MNLDIEHLSTACLCLFVGCVAFFDIRTHRIPNFLCFGAAAVGFTLQFAMHGADGGLAALTGLLVGLGIFLPFYVVRAFGAGDVKAMAAAGVFLGAEQTLVAVGATLIAGSVIGVIVLLRIAPDATSAIYRVLGAIGETFMLARGRVTSPTFSERHRFPYGAAIGAGVVVALFWSGRL